MVTTDSTLNAAEKEKIDRYKRVVTYVQKHFAHKVTLEELAREARCNPQYLCHFFKEIAEISPIQYLIMYRIERAKVLLKETTNRCWKSVWIVDLIMSVILFVSLKERKA